MADLINLSIVLCTCERRSVLLDGDDLLPPIGQCKGDDIPACASEEIYQRRGGWLRTGGEILSDFTRARSKKLL